MNQAIRTAAGIVVLGIMMVVIWNLKWIILSMLIGLSVVLFACNHFYRKTSGRDMTIYTRITGGSKK